MALIEVSTEIAAPVERCFDLARSIDFHQVTVRKSGETAVAGRTSGLIGPGETVTWRARHLGVWQHLTVRITAYSRPDHFRDVMVKGAFRAMQHDHHFHARRGSTVMVDRFEFRSPLGPLGAAVDGLFLKAYLQRFLEERNQILKAAAESDQWRPFLEGHPS
jgi:ligand-binding SRPBCC domain-containing protein